MPLDPSVVGRSYPPAPALEVTAEALAAFGEAVGAAYAGGPVPATFPIVAAFSAMMSFLDAEQLDLSRVVHGEQRFAYARPVRVGDRLTVTLSVVGLRQIAGNDIVATTSAITDADGELVCTGSATLVHRGGV